MLLLIPTKALDINKTTKDALDTNGEQKMLLIPMIKDNKFKQTCIKTNMHI